MFEERSRNLIGILSIIVLLCCALPSAVLAEDDGEGRLVGTWHITLLLFARPSTIRRMETPYSDSLRSEPISSKRAEAPNDRRLAETATKKRTPDARQRNNV